MSSDSKYAEKEDRADEFYDSGVISESCDNLYSEGDIGNDPTTTTTTLSRGHISGTDSITDKRTKRDDYKDSGIDVTKSTSDMNVDSGFISEANIPSCHSKSFENEKARPAVEMKRKENIIPEPTFRSEKLYYQDDDGNTVLHRFVLCENEINAKYIVFDAPNSDVLDIRNRNAQTCLHLAVFTNQPRIVRFLLLAGANARIEDADGNTALHVACALNNLKCVLALCDPVGHNDRNYYRFKYIPKIVPPQDYINEINYDGLSCLHIATKNQHASILGKLMLTGANINIKELKGGQTVLHEAVSNGSEDLVKLILAHPSVNVEQENYSCYTAYQLSWRYPSLWRLLLDKEALELDFVEYELEDSKSFDDSDVDEEYSSRFENDHSLSNYTEARRSEMVN